jgi:hypothetical protein
MDALEATTAKGETVNLAHATDALPETTDKVIPIKSVLDKEEKESNADTAKIPLDKEQK